MGLQCGIVGLPNVGKSTLFNALTATQAAESANYPFCTIEPNSGVVAIKDARLEKLAQMAGSQKTIHAQIEFVDIAGLVKGASKGEGLGNQFLANIREVDAIIHVLRCFENDDITHVHGKVDPINDAEVIDTELMLADLESIEKRIPGLEKKIRGGDKEAVEVLELLQAAKAKLLEGKPAREIITDKETAAKIKQQQLLTAKPILYVCNVNEDEASSGNSYTKRVEEMALRQGTSAIIISAKIEEEISGLESEEEKREFLEALDLEETGLNKIAKSSYNLLNLKSYFTVGPKEARAWTFKDGATAPEAAGIIHTDFEKGFIRAETISFDDYIKHNGEQGAKDVGRMRLEGKSYVVQDGDVIYFRFNV